MATESLTFSIGADTAAFRNQLASCGKSLAGLGASFISAQTIAEKFSQSLDMSGRLDDLSKRTGATAGQIFLLERAFKNAGSSAEKVGPVIDRLSKFIRDSSDIGSAAAKTLAGLGLEYSDLEGKLPTDSLEIVAERISQIQDPTLRTATAMDIFGKSGGELIPLLREYSAEISKAKAETGSMAKVLDESAESMANLGDSISNAKEKGVEFSTGFLSVFASAANKAFDSLKVDAAGAGIVAGNSLIDGMTSILTPAGPALSKFLKFAFKDAASEADQIAKAVEPLVEIGEKFNASLTSAADKLQIALGQKGLAESIGKREPWPWEKSRKPNMLDAENYDPDWDLNFSDANSRSKNIARADRMARIRRLAEEERRRKASEALSESVGMSGDYSDMSPEMQAVLDGFPGFSNRGPGNTIATVGDQERKRTARGDSYEGAYKRGENSSGAAHNQGVGAHGFWPDGTPKTPEEFKTGKRESAEKADAAKKGEMAKSGGKGRGQEQSPALQVLNQIAGVLARLEPKVPQPIMA